MNRHERAVCSRSNEPMRYHYKNWSAAFACPICGRLGWFNLNWLGPRKILCDGTAFTKRYLEQGERLL